MEKVPLETIKNTFDQSFEDYFVPIKMDLELLVTKIKANEVDLKLSVGVWEEQKLVGLILHGARTLSNGVKAVYNSGTGVIPNYRGKGLTVRMYEYIIPTLKNRNVEQVYLEVIDKNVSAIKSYENTGFVKTRNYSCFKGIPVTAAISIEHTSIRKEKMIQWDELADIGHIAPAWQNTNLSLKCISDHLDYYCTYTRNELSGYLIYNRIKSQVAQIAVKEQYRRQKIASALIHAIEREPDSPITFVNIDERDISLMDFCSSLALECFIKQYEMCLNL